jgi:hypothetical protein
MSRSKISIAVLAALCGLGFQFQAREAKAQSAILFPGEHLAPGAAKRSVNGHTLVMQVDGNVVLYSSDNRPVWATNTYGTPPREFIMQTDGNLVLYAADGRPLWASGTNNNPGAFLKVQDDGNLVVYRRGSVIETGDNALWASGTNGR